MGLMDILQPLAKGYFEGSVDIMEARAKEKAEAKRIDDEYKARLANSLAVLEKTKELEEESNQAEKEKNIAKNKEYANALGLTTDYIATLPDNIFEDRVSFNDFMSYKSKHYGYENWYLKPINFGPYKGQTAQEMELGTNIKTNVNFSKNNVVDNTKVNANISDSIGSVTLGDYEESGGKDENFYGQYLFDPKPTLGYSATTQWVNPTVHTEGSGKLPLSVFQIENTPGAKDYGNEYYYYDAENKLTRINLSQGWFKANEGIGLDVSKKAMNMFDTSQEVTKHMFELNGKYYPLDITTTKQNGKIVSEDVTYVSPKALDLLNINLKQYASVPTTLPDVPVEISEQKLVGFNSIEIPKDEFSQRTGSDILDYNDRNIIVEEPQRETTNLLNLSRAVDVNSKVVFGQNAFAFTQFTDEFGQTKFSMTSVLSNDPRIEAALTGLTNTTNNTEFTIQRLASNEKPENRIINPIVAETLGFTTTDASKLPMEEATLKVGQAFKSLRDDYISYYRNVLRNTPDAFDAEKVLNNIPETLEGEELAIALANINMSKIDGMESLVTNRMTFDNSLADIEAMAKTNIQSVIEKYYPNFMAPTPGDTTLNQFILDNVTSDELIAIRDEKITDTTLSKLRAALVNDIDDVNDRRIINAEIDEILNKVIDGNGFITIEDIQKREGKIAERQETISQDEQEKINTWLAKDSVELDSPDLTPGASITINGKTVIPKLDTGGTNASFFDSKTGYLIFKSPSLPPEHVEPRPTVTFTVGLSLKANSKTKTNWDALYGDTHNPDGTPKK